MIDKYENEFVSSIPWDLSLPWSGDFHHNIVRAKLGAEVLAHIDGASRSYRNHPDWITWKLDNGQRVFAWTNEMVRTSWGRGVFWEYCIDVGSNMAI